MKKLIIPKAIILSGKHYTVVCDPKRADGECDLVKKQITVGTAIKGDSVEIFLHEVLEGILYERGHRFSCYAEGNDGLRFVLTHSEFENVVKDLAQALYK